MKVVSKCVLIKELFARSWWVYLFCLVCFFGYTHFVSKRKHEIQTLQARFASLQKQIHTSSQIKEELYQQICSQTDPAWIELVLMKQLGVVPEGYLKIHFKKE